MQQIGVNFRVQVAWRRVVRRSGGGGKNWCFFTAKRATGPLKSHLRATRRKPSPVPLRLDTRARVGPIQGTRCLSHGSLGLHSFSPYRIGNSCDLLPLHLDIIRKGSSGFNPTNTRTADAFRTEVYWIFTDYPAFPVNCSKQLQRPAHSREIIISS
jgi:hypothetical protein